MRYTSIDLLRTFAIMVMVYVHFCENLSGITPKIAGFGAPLFVFLAGLSYHLWLRSQIDKQQTEELISKTTLRRGLFLFFLGIAFNVLVWLPEDTFNWDVLTLIGSSMLLLNTMRYWPSWLALLLCLCVLVVSPVARHLADWPSYWTADYYDPHITTRDVLLGYLVTGYFPILPWIVYPVLGYLVGRELFPLASGSEELGGKLRIGMYVGAILLLVSYCVPQLAALSDDSMLTSEFNWTMFPTSSLYLLGSIGFAVASFCGLYLCLDLQNPTRWPRMRSVAETFSRHSLTAYLLHHLIHIWPLWVSGILLESDTTHYWRRATTVSIAVLLATLYLPFSYLFLRWLERANRPTVESCMRWLCD